MGKSWKNALQFEIQKSYFTQASIQFFQISILKYLFYLNVISCVGCCWRYSL